MFVHFEVVAAKLVLQNFTAEHLFQVDDLAL